ncbi:hypothetical protein NPIL_12281 [Nephila pilipes]|uniref:Uncharacterized protein n=1 Tax=Nephila pilipes TaxID=299642 RepID=A0A8X6PD84_NEPPI|nr:hypothetical protein NPIL_12281 [Nephila pilipes]
MTLSSHSNTYELSQISASERSEYRFFKNAALTQRMRVNRTGPNIADPEIESTQRWNHSSHEGRLFSKYRRRLTEDVIAALCSTYYSSGLAKSDVFNVRVDIGILLLLLYLYVKANYDFFNSEYVGHEVRTVRKCSICLEKRKQTIANTERRNVISWNAAISYLIRQRCNYQVDMFKNVFL